MDHRRRTPSTAALVTRVGPGLGLAADPSLRSSAFDRLGAIAAVLDGAGTIVDVNAAWRLFAHLNDGSPQATGAGVNYLAVCDRAARAGSTTAAAVALGIRQILAGEREAFDLDYPCPSPVEDRWFMVQAAAAPIDGASGIVLFHVDITDRKLLESTLAREALHDELTGLANRRSVVRFLEAALARTAPGCAIQVLYLDVDGFKAVNDTHGHHVGDQLLVQIAARGRRVLRSGDLLGRIGGDEFVLAFPDTEPSEAWAVAGRIHRVMAAPFQVGSLAITVGVSIGLASSTPDSTVDALLAAADGELYRVKQAGGGLDDLGARGASRAAPATPWEPVPRFTRGITDAVVAHSNDLVMLFQVDGTIDWVSPAARRVFGVEPQELVGTNGFALVHPEDQARVFGDFASIPSHGDTVRTEFRVAMPTGEERWVEEIATNLLDEPNVHAVVGNIRDITDRKAGAAAATLLSAIVASSSDAIFTTDLSGTITSWNDGAVGLYGHAASEIVDRPMLLLVPDDRVAEREDRLERVRQGEVVRDYETVDRHADGRDLEVSLAYSPLRDPAGAIVGMSAVARDIADRRIVEHARSHDLTHDSLTGLSNRARLIEVLQAVLDDRDEATNGVAVALLGLDRFKAINDTAGHEVGDRVLQAVAARLRSALRCDDLLARSAGDEFVMVRTGVTAPAEAVALAVEAHDALAGALVVGDREHRLTASVGVTLSGGSDTPESLLRDADSAMYQAKDEGRDRIAVHDADARSRTQRRRTIESALGRAHACGQLQVHYQPVLDLSSCRVAGFEALLRWTHPVLGVISPAEFIPVAESSGLIGSIGDWVIDQVVDQLATWRREAVVTDDVWIAINLSAPQLADASLAVRLGRAIAAAGIPPEVVHLELTESVLMDRFENAAATVLALRAVGVKISIDDFGTGYSSLSYLDRLPIDVLKIDRSFIDRLGEERPSASIVEAIAAMAESLDLEVVAEGIETEAQLEAVRDLGCRFGQGFLWSRAMAPEDARTWMLAR